MVLPPSAGSSRTMLPAVSVNCRRPLARSTTTRSFEVAKVTVVASLVMVKAGFEGKFLMTAMSCVGGSTVPGA
jgi:hypothetical protein